MKNTHHEPSVFRSKSCRTKFRSAAVTFLSRFMYHISYSPSPHDPKKACIFNFSLAGAVQGYTLIWQRHVRCASHSQCHLHDTPQSVPTCRLHIAAECIARSGTKVSSLEGVFRYKAVPGTWRNGGENDLKSPSTEVRGSRMGCVG